MLAAPSSIDFLLSWLIGASDQASARPDRRLNAIERQIANGASQWRSVSSLDVANELRMTEATRDDLLAWVEQRQWSVDPVTRRRIMIYASAAVIEPTMPEGWVRLLVYPSTPG